MCKSLRLAYVADIYEQIPFENETQYLEAIFQKEFELREEAKGERLIKKAKFINHKDLSKFHWGNQVRFPPQLDRAELEGLHFIEKKENVVLTGSPGTGKTHLATGLGRAACQKDMKSGFIECLI